MKYSPKVNYLLDIKERLAPLNMPVFFKLPNSQQEEPFIVVGSHSSTTDKTAQTGYVIEDTSQMIDIFLPAGNRQKAEDIEYRAVRLLGRNQRISSQMMMDNSIGREVYHIIIRINELIM
ncbi:MULTISPECIES: hypothetical protein [Aerococcus]|uniref:DUF3168 domain-containing protein n=7 Tax=Bacteria TaxID=2 RepID=A0A329NY28_9LACT|nr:MULTISPECIES: hypothetical protein [Aerococcus]MDK6882002.1 hypothetical protein [Escherichia coli]KAA9242171.1 hypothetical protein F6I34_01585 [Aerococcus urinae]KAA9298652.1 hypothetical protein F6I08_04740 [Aerococcus tenax]MCY3026218.1 hypothetical protein [Aerococcus loyolae]MCY3035169.1 hypothetical protein [Aerococcus mictus]